MKPKKIKGLRLTSINKQQQKVVKGGYMAHECGGCGCISGLQSMIGVDNANVNE